MTPPVSFGRDGAVGRITLASPDTGNAIDQAFADALLDAVHRCEGDASIRSVLIAGTGRFFCVGGDVRAFAAAGDDLGSFVRRLTASLHVAIARLAALSKPVVTAVNGPAAGAGLGLAIVGDVVIAAGSAKFALAYPAIGLSPDAGTTYMLPRLIGLRRTQEMLFLGRTLSAAEAVDWRLATRTAVDSAVADEGLQLAASLADMPTYALGRSKRLLLSTYRESLEGQLELEAAAIAESAVQPHAAEGISAFLDRRKAHFD